MEKKKKNDYWWAPWSSKEGAFKEMVPVTELNRKNAIVQGRMVYIIEPETKSMSRYCGFITICPRYTKGEWLWPLEPFLPRWPEHKDKTHYKIYFDCDQDYEKYKNDYKILIDRGIANKTLYINPKDPILTFFKK